MSHKAPVYDITGNRVGEVTLPDAVFGQEPHASVMHQAVVRQDANARRGLHKTQTRTEVSRTKSKWYRQKGTGRARHGSRAAPIFVGGGVAHGPKPRSYAKRMPRKMRRLALRSALAVKAAEDHVALVERFDLATPRTKTIRQLLDVVAPGESALIVLAERNDAVERSIRNLPRARYLAPGQMSVREVLAHDRLLIEQDALAAMEATLGAAAGSGGAETDRAEEADDDA